MTHLPPSFASQSSSKTDEPGILKEVSMNDHELSNVVEQHSMQEDGCENTKQAEMETELTKVDLAEVKPQQAIASMPDSDTTSSD